MALKTHGTMAVDWENGSTSIVCAASVCKRPRICWRSRRWDALLCFDMNNVRYLTATHIGTWAQDKANRFTLLPQNDEPILWDFGSAAKHHQLNCPWLGERSRPGISMLRGAMTPRDGPRRRRRQENSHRTRNARPAQRAGRHRHHRTARTVCAATRRHRSGRRPGNSCPNARVIKTQDEISLLNTSAMMVDAAYDELYRAMKPGLRENEAVGLVSKVLYDLGSEYVEAVNAISGERCNPHPHVFSDRVLRPGDPVYYDILHSYMGYRTCYYRCFTIGYASHAMVDAYKRCRDYLDAAIELVRPGRTTAEIAAVWPKAQDFGFPNEEAAFALQYGHGIGLAIWEKPVISRLVSFDHPQRSSPAWCLRSKLSGPRPMAGARRASKKKSWSRRPDTKSSRAFPRKSFWWRARTTSRSTDRCPPRARVKLRPALACWR